MSIEKRKELEEELKQSCLLSIAEKEIILTLLELDQVTRQEI